MKHHYLLALCMLLLLFSAACDGPDRVFFTNATSGERGVLVDGERASGHANDATYVTTEPFTEVGEFGHSTQTNEVIGFNQFRPVKIKEVTWTPDTDAQVLEFDDEIGIPVTVWIVKGPISDQKAKAIDACIYTEQMFDKENVGIHFSEFKIINRTEMPNASAFYDFDGDDTTPLKNNVGYDANRINIYYLDKVSGSTTTGRAVGFEEVIVLGSNFGDIAVVHEFGHSFSLRHVDEPEFDNSNIMWPTYSTSNPWEWFSEGQTFRIHADPSSAINDQYNARPGEPTRNCLGDDGSNSCVAIDKRIWADGASWPAN